MSYPLSKLRHFFVFQQQILPDLKESFAQSENTKFAINFLDSEPHKISLLSSSSTSKRTRKKYFASTSMIRIVLLKSYNNSQWSITLFGPRGLESAPPSYHSMKFSIERICDYFPFSVRTNRMFLASTLCWVFDDTFLMKFWNNFYAYFQKYEGYDSTSSLILNI